MTFQESIKKIKDMTPKWYLRMESMSFIMVVHKKTNEYKNIYDYQFPKGMLKVLADSLDKHPAIL